MDEKITAETIANLQDDDRWGGWGYIGERSNGLDHSDETGITPADVLRIDGLIAEVAEQIGLNYDQLFTWLNGRISRHMADDLFGTSLSDAEVMDRIQRYMQYHVDEEI